MKISSRSAQLATVSCVLLLLRFGDAFAQSASSGATVYPSRPIRFVVGFAPGGPIDLLARTVGQKLAEVYGQSVIIDNRTGANGIIAADLVAKAVADGHTILMAGAGHTINASLYKLPYDTVTDFAPVTPVATGSYVLVVHPSVPVRSVQELIALAKSKPGQLSFGSGGIGGAPHMAVALLTSMAGIDMIHVPYKGVGPAITDLLGGQLSLIFNDQLTTLPYIRSGKFRALAVSSVQRSAALPDIPTVAESGLPGYEVIGWYGVFAPSGASGQVVARLNTDVARIVQMPEVRERLVSLGTEPFTATPVQFSTFVKAEVAKWAKVIKDANIKAN
jgi:tripartite-type tricarboxylate transporter receptor subunit TctC